MGNINEQIAKAEEEIRQLQDRKKKLLNQKKSEERKIMTHRLADGVLCLSAQKKNGGATKC